MLMVCELPEVYAGGVGVVWFPYSTSASSEFLRCVHYALYFLVPSFCPFSSFPVVLLSCFNQRGVALAQEQHNGLAPVMVLIVGVVGAIAAVFAFVFSGAVTGIIIFTISYRRHSCISCITPRSFP